MKKNNLKVAVRIFYFVLSNENKTRYGLIESLL